MKNTLFNSMRVTLSDTLHLLSVLSFRKLFNILKLYFSFLLSRLRNTAIHLGNPMTVSIEPTTACNLRCPECPSGLRSFTRETGKIDIDFFNSTLDALAKDLIYLIFYFQGEPFLHPKFLKMVRIAKQKKIYTITSTNGHFLNEKTARQTVESGLDRLIISVDGTTQETYEAYRKNGSLANVIEGARHIIAQKKAQNSSRPYTIFQFLVVQPNEHQIKDIFKLAKEIGIDEVKLKTAQIYDYKKGNPLIPQNEKYSRYRKSSNGLYTLKYEVSNRCWKMWHAAVITWNGKVVPCCFDKDAKHVMGDLMEREFLQIWQSEKYANFRKRIYKGREYIDICSNCSEGCKVWV